MNSSSLISLAAALGWAGSALAQSPQFNEIYGSMTGTDSYEYIELVGTPNASLDNWFVVVLDGDGAAAGVVDRVWDLTGHVVPADGYFVMGSINVANMDYDLDQGPHAPFGDANHIENGTNTYYIINIADPTGVADLLSYWNTDSDVDNDGITALGTDPRMTIHESLTVWEGNYNSSTSPDTALDCSAAIGPDLSGPFLPAGVFRPLDFPNDFCNDTWLDFNDPLSVLNTPGVANPASTCLTSPSSTGPCGGGGGGPIGTNYCSPNANSTGGPASISAFGSALVSSNDVTLSATAMPNGQWSYFVCGLVQGFVGNPGGSQGNLCVIGQLGRFNGPGQVLNSGTAGGVSLTIDITQIPIGGSPVSVQPGETWNFQLWYRDVNPTPTSNFTDGLAITFQ